MGENREVCRKTLAHAIIIAGGESALAVRLRTTPAQLTKWLSGVEEIPDQAFLDAVDLVVTEQIMHRLLNSPR